MSDRFDTRRGRPGRRTLGILALGIVFTWSLGCSRGDEGIRSDSNPDTGDSMPPAVAETDAAERAKDPRPSVVLIVVDTLRADAVSAYGKVEGTTPEIDRLAAQGVRYSRAFAPAPWTVGGFGAKFL